MSVRDTSIISFIQVKKNIGVKQTQILSAVRHLGEPTNLEMSTFLGWPINQITPRTNELVKKGLLAEAGKRPCHVSGRLALTWRTYA